MGPAGGGGARGGRSVEVSGAAATPQKWAPPARARGAWNKVGAAAVARDADAGSAANDTIGLSDMNRHPDR